MSTRRKSGSSSSSSKTGTSTRTRRSTSRRSTKKTSSSTPSSSSSSPPNKVRALLNNRSSVSVSSGVKSSKKRKRSKVEKNGEPPSEVIELQPKRKRRKLSKPHPKKSIKQSLPAQIQQTKVVNKTQSRSVVTIEIETKPCKFKCLIGESKKVFWIVEFACREDMNIPWISNDFKCYTYWIKLKDKDSFKKCQFFTALAKNGTVKEITLLDNELKGQDMIRGFLAFVDQITNSHYLEMYSGGTYELHGVTTGKLVLQRRV